MAVSDITAYVKPERDSSEAARGSAAIAQDSGDVFLDELKQADDSSLPAKKLPETNELPLEKSLNENETKMLDESGGTDSELIPNESGGGVMLAQITAAQVIDTGLKQSKKLQPSTSKSIQHAMPTHTEKVTAFNDARTDGFDDNAKKPTSNVPISEGNALSQVLTTTNKSKLADAINEQLGANVENPVKADSNKSPEQPSQMPAKIDNVVKLQKEQTSPMSNESIQLDKVAKDLNLTKAQTLQLNDKINQLNANPEQKTTPSKSATLQSMITELVNSDEFAAKGSNRLANDINIAIKPDASISSVPLSTRLQVEGLSNAEKGQLAEQINSHISNEKSSKIELKNFNQVLAQLQSPTVLAKQHTPAGLNTNNIAEQVNTNKQIKEVNSELNVKVSPQESVKQLERLDSGELTSSANKEPVSPRVTQLFNQLTTAPLTLSPQELSDVSYEQTLDTQIAQVHTTGSSSSVKTVNVDAGVMQALNIIKSDAAKMLQERVSAMLNINNKEAEIRLDPPEMGSMQIRIRSDAEQAQINFVVQNQQAKEALEQSLPKLRDMLAEQGIELGESNIEQGQSEAGPHEDNEENNHASLAPEQSEDESSVEKDQLTESTGQLSSSSIDYYA